MFGMGTNEILYLGILIAVIVFGVLSLLMPYFVYRISVNVADMRETLDSMHDMVENHINVATDNQ